jgi:hypothetical protein
MMLVSYANVEDQMTTNKSGPRKETRQVENPHQWDSFVLPTYVDSPDLNPKELFAICTAQEQRTKKRDVANVLDDFAKFYLFDRPLFGVSAEWSNSGYSLLFTIPEPVNKIPDTDWRYAEFVKHLKALDDHELRWVLVARWLKEENICEPDKFLPPDVLRRALKKVRVMQVRSSPTDVYLWRLVRIWLPYFGNLNEDRRKIPASRRGPGDALVNMGYSKDAVSWSLETHSLIQAITNWLAERSTTPHSKRVSARTLANSYSKVLASTREVISDVAKAKR